MIKSHQNAVLERYIFASPAPLSEKSLVVIALCTKKPNFIIKTLQWHVIHHFEALKKYF